MSQPVGSVLLSGLCFSFGTQIKINFRHGFEWSVMTWRRMEANAHSSWRWWSVICRTLNMQILWNLINCSKFEWCCLLSTTHSNHALDMHNGYWFRSMVTDSGQWLLIPVSGGWFWSMVTDSGQWLLIPVNGYWFRSVVADSGQWLLIHVNGYWFRSVVADSCQWLLIQVSGYWFMSMVTDSGQWLLILVSGY